MSLTLRSPFLSLAFAVFAVAGAARAQNQVLAGE